MQGRADDILIIEFEHAAIAARYRVALLVVVAVQLLNFFLYFLRYFREFYHSFSIVAVGIVAINRRQARLTFEAVE